MERSGMFELPERKAFEPIQTAQKKAADALNGYLNAAKQPPPDGSTHRSTRKLDLLTPEALQEKLQELYGRRTEVNKIEEAIKLKRGVRVAWLKSDIEAFNKQLETYASQLYDVSKYSAMEIGHIATRTVYSEFYERLLAPVREARDRVYGQLTKMRASAQEDAKLCRTEVTLLRGYKDMDEEDSKLRKKDRVGFVRFEIAAFLVIKEKVKACAQELKYAAQLLWERAQTKHNLGKAYESMRNNNIPEADRLYQEASEYLQKAQKRLNKVQSEETVTTEIAEHCLSPLDARLKELRAALDRAALDQAPSERFGIAGQISAHDRSHSAESLGDPPPEYEETPTPNGSHRASTEHLVPDREPVTDSRQLLSPSDARRILRADSSPNPSSIKR